MTLAKALGNGIPIGAMLCKERLAEALPPLARAGELAAFGLRMNAGWPFAEFTERTGFDLRTGWRTELDRLVACGWGEETADSFRLTRQGLRFADSVAEMFLRS